MQVFWAWSSFRMSAWTVPRTAPRVPAPSSASSSRSGARPRPASKAAALLEDRGVQEHRQDRRRRTVDRHRDARRRIGEPETVEQLAHVVEARDGHAALADLSEDVRAPRRILAVEGRAVEGDREPVRGLRPGEQSEPPVRPGRAALPGEHPAGALFLAPEGEHSRGERVAAGQVLFEEELQRVAPSGERRQRHPRDVEAGERVPRGAELAHPVAHRDREGGGPDPGGEFRPAGEQLAALRVEFGPDLRRPGLEIRGRGGTPGGAEFGGRRLEVLDAGGPFRLGPGPAPLPAERLGDLGEIPGAGWRDERRILVEGNRLPSVRRWPPWRRPGRRRPVGQAVPDQLVEAVEARIPETAGHRRRHRHRRATRQPAGPAERLADREECVGSSGVVRLVQRHRIGEVEHVDLLELALGAEVGGHHMEREIADVHDPGAPLPDPAGLHDHESEPGGAQHEQRVPGDRREFAPRPAGGEAPHEDAGIPGGAQPDPVAEERAPGAALRRIHREHADALDRAGAEVRAPRGEAEQQLVEHRALPCPAGAGDPENRGRDADLRLEPRPLRFAETVVLGQADEAGRRPAPGRAVRGEGGHELGEGLARAPAPGGERVFEHVRHHSLDPERPAFGG